MTTLPQRKNKGSRKRTQGNNEIQTKSPKTEHDRYTYLFPVIIIFPILYPYPKY